MFKLPFINKFITDDQEFYDVQINEELKHCYSSNFIIEFAELGKNKRAFIIRIKEGNPIVIIFNKSDYKGINEALEKIRLNIALIEKENLKEQSLENNITIHTSSEEKVNVQENDIYISTMEQLLINNNPLKEKEEIIKRLIELSIQNDRSEPYLDFYEAGYDKGIQNYLAMSLYKEPINLNDRLVNAITFYKSKDPKIYHLVNSFLRGNFDEMINYLNSKNNPIAIRSIPRICQNIIQAQEELPNRTYDLMIYRAGLGVNKDKTLGARNVYESFVSFGTSGGTLGDPIASDEQPIIYKKILKKNEKAIPVDLIEGLGIIYLDGSQENEFLLPPFEFQITDIAKEDDYDTYFIEETGKINSRELLDKRLHELEEYLKSKNDMEQYRILKKSHKGITRKSKKKITGYNLKDIYYSLRPKAKKSNRGHEDAEL